MRILVLSDSHGDAFSVRLAIEQQPSANIIFFLGDGENDIDGIEDSYKSKIFIKVRGNCDFGSFLPAYALEKIGGKTVYACHGYAEHVKYGEDNLVYRALEMHADIVLYGHTHTPVSRYEDGLYILNPGSIREGIYGVVDITSAGIVCFNVKLRYI